MKKKHYLSEDQKLDLQIFMKDIISEEDAIKYIQEKRWSLGIPRCPFCDSCKTIKLGRKGYWRCSRCRNDFTVRIGTFLQNSHTPLKKWLSALYLLHIKKIHVTSLISKECKVTNKTAIYIIKTYKNLLETNQLILVQIILNNISEIKK